MGYSTIQISNFQINGEVTHELVSYINNFSESRRVRRSNEKIKELYPNWRDYCLNNELGTEGEYFACPSELQSDASILDYNTPPQQHSLHFGVTGKSLKRTEATVLSGMAMKDFSILLHGLNT